MARLARALLAIAVGLRTTGLGLDRNRACYPVVTIVIASYYALLAWLPGSGRIRAAA